MSNIVSLAEVRATRLRARLGGFAASQSPAAVETRRGLVCAQRIFCRENFAVLIDRYGYQTAVEYDNIVEVSPMLPMAEIVSLLEWDVVEETAANPRPNAVVCFPRR